MAFSQKEKRVHYNAVAKGEKPVKKPSKFAPQRQKDYAKGQADARNEAAAIYKYNQSSQEQRDTFKTQKADERKSTYTAKCKICKKPCSDKYPTCYDCFKAGKLAPLDNKVVAVQNPKTEKVQKPKDSFYSKYTQLKKSYKDAILFLRLGDFYEVLGSDAKKVSKELGLTLVSRNIGDTKVPMCGVPYHTIEQYLAKLTQKGFKVALAEN